MWDTIKTLFFLFVMMFLVFFCTNYFYQPGASIESLSENPKEILLTEFPKFKEFWVSQDLPPYIKQFGLRWNLQPFILGLQQYANNFLQASPWREYLQEKEDQLSQK